MDCGCLSAADGDCTYRLTKGHVGLFGAEGLCDPVRTHYVASTTLDEARLAKDIEQSASFVWSEAYSDYLFGGAWKSCMLWARGGDAGDGVVTNYDHDRPSFDARGGHPADAHHQASLWLEPRPNGTMGR